MENGEVRTKDMYIAALLLSYGSKVDKIDRGDRSRQFFEFDALPKWVWIVQDGVDPESYFLDSFKEMVSLYLSKKIVFPPNYVDCLRSIKTYIYQE